MALSFDAKPGDSIRVGPDTTITFEHKSGRVTRVRIESKQDVQLDKAGRSNAPAAPSPQTAKAPFSRPF